MRQNWQLLLGAIFVVIVFLAGTRECPNEAGNRMLWLLGSEAPFLNSPVVGAYSDWILGKSPTQAILRNPRLGLLLSVKDTRRK